MSVEAKSNHSVPQESTATPQPDHAVSAAPAGTPDAHGATSSVESAKQGVSVDAKSGNAPEAPLPANMVPPVGNYTGVDTEINRSINMATSESPAESRPSIWPVWNTALSTLGAWGASGGATLAGVPYAIGHAAVGASIGDTIRWVFRGEKAGNHLASIFQKSEKPSLFERIKRVVTAPSRWAILRSMKQDSVILDTARVRALNPGALERFSDNQMITHAAVALQRSRAGETMVMSSKYDKQNWGSEVNDCLGRYKDGAIIASTMRAEYGRRQKERIARTYGTESYKQRMYQLSMMRFDEQIREKADWEDTKMHIKNIALNSAAIGLVSGAVTAAPAVFEWARGIVTNTYNSISTAINKWWASDETVATIDANKIWLNNFFDFKRNTFWNPVRPIWEAVKGGVGWVTAPFKP